MATPDGSGDVLLRTLSQDGGITVRALEATRVVAEAAQRHATGPLVTVALGRVLMGAILLGAGGKHDETVQLRFRGNGPLRTLLAIADAGAHVKGYATRLRAELDPSSGVAQAIGLGDLAVVRHRPGWNQPYTGIVPIVHGEIAQDLALYLTESEQMPSAVALGVQLDGTGEVTAAAGYLAQALPGAAEEMRERLEANVESLPSPSHLVRGGEGARAIAERLLHGMGLRELEAREARFLCGCTRERVIRAVALLGKEEVEELRVAGVPIEVRCEFCAERYEIDPDHVRALFPDA
jgi:molecular chaperone Hsp33